MKRFRIFSLILVVLLVLGFSFTACDNGSTGGSGGGGSFANTNWRSDFMSEEMRLSFITSEDWAVYGLGIQLYAGNYTVSSGKATLWYMGYEFGKATISGNTLTMLGELATYGNSWIRE
jgi:hypothetical protein